MPPPVVFYICPAASSNRPPFLKETWSGLSRICLRCFRGQSRGRQLQPWFSWSSASVTAPLSIEIQHKRNPEQAERSFAQKTSTVAIGVLSFSMFLKCMYIFHQFDPLHVFLMGNCKYYYLITNYEENKADLVWDPLAKVEYMKDMMAEIMKLSGGRLLFFKNNGRSGIWISVRKLDNMEYNLPSQKPAYRIQLKAVMSFLLAFWYMPLFSCISQYEEGGWMEIMKNVSSERITTAVGKASICKHSEDQ